MQDESQNINSQRVQVDEAKNVSKQEILSLNNTIDGPVAKKKTKENRTIVYNVKNEPLDKETPRLN